MTLERIGSSGPHPRDPAAGWNFVSVLDISSLLSTLKTGSVHRIRTRHCVFPFSTRSLLRTHPSPRTSLNRRTCSLCPTPGPPAKTSPPSPEYCWAHHLNRQWNRMPFHLSQLPPYFQVFGLKQSQFHLITAQGAVALLIMDRLQSSYGSLAVKIHPLWSKT